MLTNSTEELVVRAESGDVEAIKELASFFRESNEEIDQRKAFMLYQKANEISSGDPKTIAQLASCYYDGIGTKKDTAKGIKMLREAAESDDSTVQYLFACKLKENNNPECIEWFDRVYNAGEAIAPAAAYNIAQIYKEGMVVEQDQQKYLEYSWKAAESGNRDALCELSAMYLNSGKTEKIKESIPSLEKLANIGSVDAAEALANLYTDNVYEENDFSKALEWASIAARNGDPEFAYELVDKIKGCLYVDTFKNYIWDIAKCLDAAAQKNYLKAIHSLAYMYYYDDDIKNTEKGKFYCIRALELNDTTLLGLLRDSCDGKNEYEYFFTIESIADNGCAAAAMEMYNIYCNGHYVPKDENKAKEYLEKAVEAEYPHALLEMGRCYAYGNLGYPENGKAALSFWTRAAEGKDGTAAELIGNLYQDGMHDTPQNIDTAIEWYNKAIECGNPEGYTQIGVIYEKSEYGRQNYDKSLHYYTKGYECESIRSTLALARKYEDGIGVESDPFKAFVFFKHAADHSFIKDIIVKVATICLEGKGTEVNPVMAVEYLERVQFFGDTNIRDLLNEARSKCTPEALLEHSVKEAEKGNHKAEYDLYELYCGGKGVPQDSDKAMDYLKKSADGGYVIALDKLGEIEINRKNYILAAEYWEKAIQNGFSSLHMYTLASLYIEGNYGIQQNMQRGVELMHKAAELGYPDAQNELGVLYYQGEGVSQNYTEAFKWVQMSANAGSALAQRNLGMFYKQGIGCNANTAMAASWYEKASNQGDFDATVCYAYMLYKGDGVAKQPERTKRLFHKILDTKGLLKTDPELYNNVLYSLASLYTEDLNDPFSAFPLWKEAADLGNPAAQYNLGLCYLKGSGTEKNVEKAKAQFTKALNNGVEEARKGLELIKQGEEIEEMKRRQQSVQEYAQRVQRGGCYVATAVYGSYDCPEVWVLRRFRDYRLSATKVGRIFIKTYYKVSPICVRFFGKTRIFNRFFKGILDRMVNKLRAEGYEDLPYYDKE